MRRRESTTDRSIYDTNRTAQVGIITVNLPQPRKRFLFTAKVEFSNNLNDTFVVWEHLRHEWEEQKKYSQKKLTTHQGEKYTNKRLHRERASGRVWKFVKRFQRPLPFCMQAKQHSPANKYVLKTNTRSEHIRNIPYKLWNVSFSEHDSPLTIFFAISCTFQFQRARSVLICCCLSSANAARNFTEKSFFLHLNHHSWNHSHLQLLAA